MLRLLAFAVLCPCAVAGTVSQTVHVPAIQYPGVTSAQIAGFDRTLGHLDSVVVSGTATVNGAILVENTTPYVQGIGIDAICGGFVSVGSGGGPFMVEPFEPSIVLQPFDGVLDYAGPSAFVLPVAQTASHSHTGIPDAYSILAWSAAQITVSTATYGSLTPVDPPPLPPELMQTVIIAFTASFDITVDFNYSDYPETFCLAYGSGIQCPCLPSLVNFHGCPNSANPAGAALIAYGTASISNSSLFLTAALMPPSAMTLLFEGTQPHFLGTTFGGGIRCVGGAVRRVQVTQASGGLVSYSPLAIAPATAGYRCYQVWYRDPASACSPAPYNLTNAVGVMWTP